MVGRRKARLEQGNARGNGSAASDSASGETILSSLPPGLRDEVARIASQVSSVVISERAFSTEITHESNEDSIQDDVRRIDEGGSSDHAVSTAAST
jgi:hypothetical protein